MWSNFTAPKADEEWLETHGDRMNELSENMHAQMAGRRSSSNLQETTEEFTRIQQELQDVRAAHDRKAKIMYFSGLAIALVGVGLGLWARAEQPD
jgi:hypothetical protein